MHYIVGTSFSITPKINLSNKDKRFKIGIIYKLFNIIKKEEKYFYKFLGSDRSIIECNFNNCREGDKFISILRGEKLPDYEKVEEEITAIDD